MKTKLPSLITILVLTVLTSIVWISLGVYRALTAEPSPSVPEEVSQPLTPTLDINTINDIKSKQFIDPNLIPTTVITISTPLPSQTPTATESPSASASATPTETSTATPTPTP